MSHRIGMMSATLVADMADQWGIEMNALDLYLALVGHGEVLRARHNDFTVERIRRHPSFGSLALGREREIPPRFAAKASIEYGYLFEKDEVLHATEEARRALLMERFAA